MLFANHPEQCLLPVVTFRVLDDSIGQNLRASSNGVVPFAKHPEQCLLPVFTFRVLDDNIAQNLHACTTQFYSVISRCFVKSTENMQRLRKR